MSAVARILNPWVVVPVFVGIALVGAILPPIIGYAPYGQQAIDLQTDRENGALCEKFQFVAGTEQYSACKSGLADLRLRHERLLLR